MKCEMTTGMFPLMLLLTITFPCTSHRLTAPGLPCANVGADHPCCKDESCILALAAGTADGLERPNLFSLSSLFSATPGHLAGPAAHPLAQFRGALPHPGALKAFPLSSHPHTCPSSNLQSSFCGMSLQKAC